MGTPAKVRGESPKRPKTAGITAVTAKSGLALVPQPERGGALLSGGMPGNRGGTGRPKSAVRKRLLESFDERIPILEQIADGIPVEHTEIPLAAVVGHLICPKCDKPLVLKDPAMALVVTVEAKRSARASDRIKATSELARFGLGERTEQVHTLVSPDIKARMERMATLILSRDVWPRADLVEALRPIWSDEPGEGAV